MLHVQNGIKYMNISLSVNVIVVCKRVSMYICVYAAHIRERERCAFAFDYIEQCAQHRLYTKNSFYCDVFDISQIDLHTVYLSFCPHSQFLFCASSTKLQNRN